MILGEGLEVEVIGDLGYWRLHIARIKKRGHLPIAHS